MTTHASRDKRIEVRVGAGEVPFRTLDGQDRALVKGDMLICDGSGPVALAGVMGGENSEISAATKDVALESAFFNPLLIRRTARRLDLRSEASSRFEKGIDIENVDFAARRAIELMQRTAGGSRARGQRGGRTKSESRATIALSLKRTRELIGTPLSREEVVDGLASIGIKLEGGHPPKDRGEGVSPNRSDDAETLSLLRTVVPPRSERVRRPHRGGGPHRRLRRGARLRPGQPPSPRVAARRETADIDAAKTYLAAAGFFEVINYGFFGVKDIENFHLLRRPTSAHPSCPYSTRYRKSWASCAPSLPRACSKTSPTTRNRGTKNLRIFEVGKVFFRSDGSVLPRESMHLACAISGKEREYFWRDAVKEFDFFDLKGVLEGLFERFNLRLRVVKAESPFLESAEAADLFADDRKVGWIGALRDSVRAAYNADETVWCCELDLDVLGQCRDPGKGLRTHTPLPGRCARFFLLCARSGPCCRPGRGDSGSVSPDSLGRGLRYF